MVEFKVNDMSCNHCVGTITKAVKAADPKATLAIDLSRHLVQIEPGERDAKALEDAIREAGYTPEPLA
jgi:copper chaperone CopZ